MQTDLPSLIIEGDMDPITPPPNAKAILPGFENGTYVEFPFAGHGPSRSVECAGDMLNLFYDDPVGEPDLGCVEEMEEPEIFAPLYTSDIAPTWNGLQPFSALESLVQRREIRIRSVKITTNQLVGVYQWSSAKSV